MGQRRLQAVGGIKVAQIAPRAHLEEAAQGQDVGLGPVPRREEVLHHVV